jgi:hypothetical protein
MSVLNDPFEVIVAEETGDAFAELSRRAVARVDGAPPSCAGAVIARFTGFDQDDRPLLVGLPGLAHEVVPARTTISLRQGTAGAQVVVLLEQGNPRQPIIMGVLQERAVHPESHAAASVVAVKADEDRIVVSAEREIVLSCGKASITLTRAGKVLIKGAYVLTRSSGYNKIKGAVVDIN